MYDATPKSATVTTTPSGSQWRQRDVRRLATAPTNAGSYAVVASLTNADYQATDATGTLVIDKAPLTVTAENKTHPYGDPAVAFTVASPDSSGVRARACSVAPWCSLARPRPRSTRRLRDHAGGLTSSNYEIGFVDGTLSITTRPVTVTADALTKVYGDPDPAFTYRSRADRSRRETPSVAR